MKYQIQQYNESDLLAERKVLSEIEGTFTEDAITDWFFKQSSEIKTPNGFKLTLVPSSHAWFIQTSATVNEEGEKEEKPSQVDGPNNVTRTKKAKPIPSKELSEGEVRRLTKQRNAKRRIANIKARQEFEKVKKEFGVKK